MRGTEAPRKPLNRARVVAAAMALADDEGIDAVSMRGLAEDLGVVPMALYKHVADKEDLLDGMVDALIAEMPATPPLPPRQWQEGLRVMLLGARSVVISHAWARRVIETRTSRTPAVLDHMERVTQIFLRAGFSADLTHHVMHLLGNRIWGFSPELFNESAGSADRKPGKGGTPDPANYPGILAITADAQTRRPGAGCDEDFEFAFGLDTIIDGIARRRRAGWTSTKPKEKP